MHLLSKSFGSSDWVNQLDQHFKVSECRLSIEPKDGQADMRPSLDPDNKEVLIISSINTRLSMDTAPRANTFDILLL